MNSISQFWAIQTESLHRGGGEEFYRMKAAEHASVLSAEDARLGILDLGCGAGELLEFLAPLANVKVGLDLSASMLDSARRRLLRSPDIELIQADIFDYLPSSQIPVWMTTGAINQYLTLQDLVRFLDLFNLNAGARSLYLFDCVDPLRYRLMRHGISYRSEQMLTRSSLHRVKSALRRTYTAAQLALGVFESNFQYLGSPGMGYGQLPRFWLLEGGVQQLSVEIMSSRYYEYRYHVRITKGNRGAS